MSSGPKWVGHGIKWAKEANNWPVLGQTWPFLGQKSIFSQKYVKFAKRLVSIWEKGTFCLHKFSLSWPEHGSNKEVSFLILVWSWRTWLGASAVGVASIRAGRVVTAVPAFAIRGTLLRVHTLVDSVIEDQTCNFFLKYYNCFEFKFFLRHIFNHIPSVQPSSTGLTPNWQFMYFLKVKVNPLSKNRTRHCIPARGRMGEGGMSKGLPVGTNSFTVRALKALNVGLRLCLLTFPCERRGLLLPHTSALQRNRKVKLPDQRVAV